MRFLTLDGGSERIGEIVFIAVVRILARNACIVQIMYSTIVE